MQDCNQIEVVDNDENTTENEERRYPSQIQSTPDRWSLSSEKVATTVETELLNPRTLSEA